MVIDYGRGGDYNIKGGASKVLLLQIRGLGGGGVAENVSAMLKGGGGRKLRGSFRTRV